MKYDGQHLKSVAVATATFTLPAVAGGLIWLYFLAPLPVIFFLIYQGFDKGFKIIGHSVLVSMLLTLLFGSLSVLLSALSLLPVGFVLARSINRKESVQHSAMQGVLLLAGIWLISWTIVGVSSQSNVYTDVLKAIDVSLEAAHTAYSQSPDISADVQYELQSIFTRVRELIPRVFPGIMAVSVISTIFINMALANALLIKRNCPSWQHFSLFRLPDYLVWPLICGGVLQFSGVSGYSTIGLNLLIVFGSLYFFQGLSVVMTYFSRWSVPRPVRLLIVFFLVIQAYGFLTLTLLGVADIWADFRKPRNDSTPVE